MKQTKKLSYDELTEMAQRAVVVMPEETDRAWQRFRARTRAGKESPESFIAWLRRAALCRGRAFLRGMLAEPALAELTCGMDEEPATEVLEPTRAEQVACNQVWMELKEMERPERFAVILHCLDGVSFRAVGRRMGLTEGQAHHLVNRGLSRLQRNLHSVRERVL